MNDKISLAFGNDISRLVRGMAIILMVCNHSMPGRVIGFAVPLFSFLVGYGFAFARNPGLHHSFHRVCHLLRGYWLVLFAVCIPVALLTYPKPISLSDGLLAAFGLNPVLNFYAWYVYFYIFAMLLMPGVSKLINKRPLPMTLLAMAFCGGCFWALSAIPGGDKYLAVRTFTRCFRYFPIVLAGYYLASTKAFSRFHYRPSWRWGVPAVAFLVGIYLLRGVVWLQVADFFWASLAAMATAIIFGIWKLRWLRIALNRLGLMSMNIWFLHALFFTHSTRKVFFPLISWIKEPLLLAVVVVVLSWMMAELLELIVKTSKKLWDKVN